MHPEYKYYTLILVSDLPPNQITKQFNNNKINEVLNCTYNSVVVIGGQISNGSFPQLSYIASLTDLRNPNF